MKEKRRSQPAFGVGSVESLRIGALGSPGSFSDDAARAYAEREQLQFQMEFKAGFDDILEGLYDDALDLGILPVANTVGGLVRGSFEAMGRFRFQPVGQIAIEIRHCLIVRSNEVRSQDIERVVSHPQAIAQCSGYLSRELPGREWLEWSDTASAAKELSERRLDPGVAGIASKRAAQRYGLCTLAEDVPDDARNETRFVLVRRLAE